MAARFCTNCGRPLTETERQFRLTTCAACAASAGATPPTPAEQGTLPSEPPPGETSVNLRIDYPERLSRWLLFVKWLFVIPVVIVVGLYGIAVFVTTFISFWAILFTGRYPSGLFDFARGYMELYARAVAYFPLLLTDQYPLGSDVGSTVHYEVEEPEGLSRGLLLLKLGSFLLSVVGTLTGIVAVVLVIAAIPAWFGILFTGRYPRGMFDFMVAVVQWIARVTGWQYLMRDEWSLFATTQGVGVLVGAGAVAVAVLTIVNYATGGFSFEFETGDDQDGAGFIQDLLETPAPTTEEGEEDAVTPAAATETPIAQPTQSPEAPTLVTPALPYEEFVSPRLGYRIETPEEWITAEDFPIEFGGESFLADYFLSPVPEQGFSANVGVLGVPALGRTFDQIIVLERASIREFSENIQEADLVIAEHEAKIIHSTSAEEGELLDFSQVFVVIDDTEWVLTLATLPGYRDRYLPIFEHMYNSFRP